MSRRTERAAEDAARAASDAARVMQQRSVESRVERQDSEPDRKPEISADSTRFEKAMANRPSALAMDEILAKRGDSEPEAPEIEPEKPVEAPKAEAAPEAPPVVEAAPEAPKAPEMVKVKVDGEEFEAPKEEVEAAGGIHAYQRDKASENRLRKATETAAETKRLMAQMAEMFQKSQVQAKPEVTDDQFIQSKMDEIRFGTPEQSAAALREVLQRANKQVDPAQIIEAATQKIAWEGAVAKFRDEFADVVSNPVLMAAADALDRQKRSNTKVVDWINHFRTIGNEVRSAFGRSSQLAPQTTATASTPSPQSEKEARKASITVLPTASARAELPKEEKELSPEEERRQWIAEQKKARGQG